jgi:hypothetical protein
VAPTYSGRSEICGSGVNAAGAASMVFRLTSAAPIRPSSRSSMTTRTIRVFRGTRTRTLKADTIAGKLVES